MTYVFNALRAGVNATGRAAGWVAGAPLRGAGSALSTGATTSALRTLEEATGPGGTVAQNLQATLHQTLFATIPPAFIQLRNLLDERIRPEDPQAQSQLDQICAAAQAAVTEIREDTDDSLEGFREAVMFFANPDITVDEELADDFERFAETIKRVVGDLQARQGVVPQLETTAVQLVDGLVARVAQQLNASAHPVIIDAVATLRALKETPSWDLVDQSRQRLIQILQHGEQNRGFLNGDMEQAVITAVRSFESLEGRVDYQTIREIADPVLVLLEQIVREEAGVLAQAGMKVEETVNRMLDRVEGAPRRLMNGFTRGATHLSPRPSHGPQRTPRASSSSSPSPRLERESEPPVLATSMIASVMDYIHPFLRTGLETVGGPILETVAGMVNFGLSQVAARMGIEGSGYTDQQIQEVHDLQEQLETQAATRDLQGFYQSLSQVLSLLQGVNVYVNGVRMPSLRGAERVSTEELGSVLNRTIDELREANPLPTETLSPGTPRDWKALAQQEKDILVENTTNFLAVMYICESVCHLPSNAFLYREWLAEAKANRATPHQLQENLKRLLFNHLKKERVGVLRRAQASFYYWVYQKQIKTLIRQCANGYFEEFFRYVESQKADGFRTARGTLITNTNRYLTILGGAYASVASRGTLNSTRRANGTIDEMLHDELSTRDRNGGFTPDELYHNFTRDLLKKATRSSFLASLVHRWLGSEDLIVKGLIDLSLGSIKDEHGYAYAINRVVREQLEEVCTILQRESSEDAAISPDHREELRTLVHQLFEILQKSKCSSLDDLRGVVDGRMSASRAGQMVDALFIEQVIQRVSILLGVSVELMVQEDQLHKLFYNLSSLMNETFSPGGEHSQAEAEAEERRVEELLSKILNLSINTAVRKEFDLTGRTEQVKANSYIESLQRETRDFLREIQTLLDSTPLHPSTINQLTLKFYETLNRLRFDVESSGMRSHNVLKIFEEIRKVVDGLTVLRRNLGELKTVAEQINGLQQRMAQQVALRQALEALEQLLAQESIRQEELLPVLRQVETPLAQLQRDRSDSIRRELGRLSQQFLTARKKVEVFSNTSLEEVIAERRGKQVRGMPITVEDKRRSKEALDTLRAAILCTDKPTATQLNQSLTQLMSAIGEGEIPGALAKFREEKALALEIARREAQRIQEEFLGIIRKLREEAVIPPTEEEGEILQMEEDCALKKGETVRALQEAIPLTDQITPISFLNFHPIDASGAIDTITRLVTTRIHARCEGLLQLARKEHTYRFGILHHALLIPYMRGIGARPSLFARMRSAVAKAFQ